MPGRQPPLQEHGPHASRATDSPRNDSISLKPYILNSYAFPNTFLTPGQPPWILPLHLLCRATTCPRNDQPAFNHHKPQLAFDPKLPCTPALSIFCARRTFSPKRKKMCVTMSEKLYFGESVRGAFFLYAAHFCLGSPLAHGFFDPCSCPT